MEYKRGSLSNEELIHLYESILWPRMIEEKMLVLLRQGKISKWFSGIGQEAIAVGATLAMDPTEWIMPLHRNLGVFTSRKMPLTDFFKQWQGREIGLFLAVIIYIFLFFRASTFYKKTIMSLLFIHFCIINGFIAFSFFMVALNASGW